MPKTPKSSPERIRLVIAQLLIEEAFPNGLDPTPLPYDTTTTKHINAHVLVEDENYIFMGVIYNVRANGDHRDVYVRDSDGHISKVPYGGSFTNDIWLLDNVVS